MAPGEPEQEYASSIAFEVDEEAETLGDRVPTTIDEDEQRVLLHKARSSRVSLDVVTVAHGTYSRQPATLIGLLFKFSYPHQSVSRLTSAELSISFQPIDGSSKFPSVRRFGPTSIQDANPTSATVVKTTSFGASLSAGDGISPVTAGLSAERGTEISFTQDFRCEVVGEPWTSDEAYDTGCELDNAVTWYVKENQVKPAGIPRELRAVVVVARSQKVVLAKVKAKVKTGWGLSLLGSLFPDERPLLIGDGVVFGETPALSDFGALSAEQLNKFVGLDRP